MKHGTTNDARVQVAFTLDPNAWHGCAVETIWCVDLGNGTYRVDNIPFYAIDVAVGDTLKASRSGDSLLAGSVARRSGHSTYRIIMLDEGIGQDQFLERWPGLAEHGCSYEGSGTGLFAIDVPKSADCRAVYAVLEAGQEEGVWDFEEGHFGGN